jgi:Sulfatase
VHIISFDSAVADDRVSTVILNLTFGAPMKTRSYFVILVFLLAANIPFWIASHSLWLILKGPFNDEFVLVGILSLFVRRWVTVGLLLIAMLLDLTNGIASTYMLGGAELLQSSRSAFEFVPSHLWDVVVVAICIVMVCLLVAAVSDCGIVGKERRYTASALAIFLIFGVTIDASTGHILTLRQDRQLGTICLTRLGTHFLVMSRVHRRSFTFANLARADGSVRAASSVTMVGFDVAARAPRTNATLPNVVLILVESWGKSVAGEIEESLVRPYAGKDLAAMYTVERGTVPFYGPTVAGEARELCGSAMGFGLLTATRPELKNCLPMRMKERGYHSTAVHGFTGRMFDRAEWYGRIGFDETWFRDRLQGKGLPLCPGPFPGICDADAAKWIGERLERGSDSPQFIYWVTLNSHLPEPIPNRVKAPPSCSDASITAEEPAMCSWYQLVFNVHRSVAEMAMRPTARPTIFLIVGDHAPPFSAAKLRAQFSDELVPYVLLTPKPNERKEGLPATRSVVAAMTRSGAGARRPAMKKGRRSTFSAAAAG